MSKFIYEQTKTLSLNLPLSKIEKEIKNNYSFYWYHFLNVQLTYIKFWQEKLKDLEMLLIALQVIILTLAHSKRKKLIESEKELQQAKTTKNISTGGMPDISATSISDITGIPRATCIRKLDKFVKMKILEKDKKTRRYFLLNNEETLNPMLDAAWLKQKIALLADFSSIVIRGLSN